MVTKRQYNKLLKLYHEVKESLPLVSLTLYNLGKKPENTNKEKVEQLLDAIAELEHKVIDLRIEAFDIYRRLE